MFYIQNLLLRKNIQFFNKPNQTLLNKMANELYGPFGPFSTLNGGGYGNQNLTQALQLHQLSTDVHQAQIGAVRDQYTLAAQLASNICDIKSKISESNASLTDKIFQSQIVSTNQIGQLRHDINTGFAQASALIYASAATPAPEPAARR